MAPPPPPATTGSRSRPSPLVRSLSSEVNCDRQRIRCRMGHLFALLLLLVAASVWTSARVLRRSAGADGLDLLAATAGDLKLADVAAELGLVAGGLGDRAARLAAAQQAALERRLRREAQRRMRRLRNRNLAPKVAPRAASLAASASCAACMLVKDDNDILGEWIAYHYFVLRLRKIVIAVDPLSTESPSEILDRWRRHTDMEIIEWRDEDYMPADFLRNGYPPSEYLQKQTDFKHEMSAAALLEISNHRYRQRVFLAQCMKEHRRRGNSWVIHIDTDEYIMASKLLRQVQPDYLTIPPLDQPGSMLDLLQQVVTAAPERVSYPCISMLRLLFGSVESKPHKITKMVPPGFNASQFETLRWRYHALPHNMSLHGNPKVIVDVAAIPEEYFPDVVYSIHRPVEAYCPKNKELEYTAYDKQPIGVNHYIGSWERYSGRNDRRRSRLVYNQKAHQTAGKDDGARPWLAGLVRQLGPETVARLLGDRYLSPPHSSSGGLFPQLTMSTT